MLRISASLGLLFADRPLLERIAAAAACGFRAVEFHFPYDVPAADVRAALARHGLAAVSINTPIEPGGFGLAAVPGRESDFAAGFERALAYAVAIGAGAIHCMAGVAPGASRRDTDPVFVRNLVAAADKAHAAGVRILIEPINRRDRPGYALSEIEHAADVVRMAARPNLQILFDCYHVQIMQGDLLRRFASHCDLIGHVQFAAVPDRGEPDQGEVDYGWLLPAFEAAGYRGWMGAEYRPRGTTEAGLGWMARWHDARRFGPAAPTAPSLVRTSQSSG